MLASFLQIQLPVRTASQRPRSQATNAARRRPTVLVVEDVYTRVSADLLGSLAPNCEVLSARGVATGCAMARATHPDLIVVVRSRFSKLGEHFLKRTRLLPFFSAIPILVVGSTTGGVALLPAPAPSTGAFALGAERPDHVVRLLCHEFQPAVDHLVRCSRRIAANPYLRNAPEHSRLDLANVTRTLSWLNHQLEIVSGWALSQSGRDDLSDQPVDLVQVARECILACAPTTTVSGVNLEVNAPANLIVRGDPLVLRLLVATLIRDAVAAAVDTVALTLSRDNDRILLVVSFVAAAPAATAEQSMAKAVPAAELEVSRGGWLAMNGLGRRFVGELADSHGVTLAETTTSDGCMKIELSIPDTFAPLPAATPIHGQPP